jgi:Type ISP C-terminal specificity domain
LLASAELGKQVAALLDTETPVLGVTAGKIRAELVKLAVVTRPEKEKLNLSVTAGWGHAGQGGVTMPGKGKLVTSIPAAGPDDKLPWREFHDVYLNDSCCWKDVPAEVWDYTIGGYQVIKKWLSYREFELLGRALTPDEAREVTHMARRIAALILLQPELDRNYQAVKAATVSL